jgi:hypothetical protein
MDVMAKRSDKGTQPAKAAGKPEKGSSKAAAVAEPTQPEKGARKAETRKKGTPVREM